MSQYSLNKILEGMSNAEFRDAKEADRLEAHPERETIKKIQALMRKEKENKNLKEINSKSFDALDKLVDRSLKYQFLDIFRDIYDDIISSGNDIDSRELLLYLQHEIQEYVDRIGLEPYIDENNSNPTIFEGDNDLDKKLSLLQAKIKNHPKSHIQLYIDSVNRDIKRGAASQYDDMSVEDMVEDFENYIADKRDDIDEGLREHFNRFMKTYQ